MHDHRSTKVKSSKRNDPISIITIQVWIKKLNKQESTLVDAMLNSSRVSTLSSCNAL